MIDWSRDTTSNFATLFHAKPFDHPIVVLLGVCHWEWSGKAVWSVAIFQNAGSRKELWFFFAWNVPWFSKKDDNGDHDSILPTPCQWYILWIHQWWINIWYRSPHFFVPEPSHWSKISTSSINNQSGQTAKWYDPVHPKDFKATFKSVWAVPKYQVVATLDYSKHSVWPREKRRPIERPFPAFLDEKRDQIHYIFAGWELSHHCCGDINPWIQHTTTMNYHITWCSDCGEAVWITYYVGFGVEGIWILGKKRRSLILVIEFGKCWIIVCIVADIGTFSLCYAIETETRPMTAPGASERRAYAFASCLPCLSKLLRFITQESWDLDKVNHGRWLQQAELTIEGSKVATYSQWCCSCDDLQVLASIKLS